ncbi:MAG TPA: hypothetical protein VFR94_19155 [Nitrososphaeraceae archaeon]|nr:hypothetical protein [Nitrososphaeraceae archaeon]
MLRFKWRKDKESNGTVKIISEAGEEIGEIRLISTAKKNEK